MRALAIAGVALLAACSAEPDATSTQPNGALQPVSITLPAEIAALPATPAGELVTQRCTACHSADMIARQPPLTAEKWQATVTKMREAYHAPISPADEPAIVAALVTLQGAPARR
ncbi:cytochrome C nitrite reductase [Sphingomonas sp. HHU CXW]|uniref:Cytochrome C nitrite reductase n=1 Tax=Sphingomonas hominis TaxID=2741495 RepID=A0ABX2JGJ7_9SPHN|nr:cytochrome C nitrite reductase [Sphingomonas hominis]NTS64914.1 cytochrome C nitrite reductase [Sphingomonas hominis]